MRVSGRVALLVLIEWVDLDVSSLSNKRRNGRCVRFLKTTERKHPGGILSNIDLLKLIGAMMNEPAVDRAAATNTKKPVTLKQEELEAADFRRLRVTELGRVFEDLGLFAAFAPRDKVEYMVVLIGLHGRMLVGQVEEAAGKLDREPLIAIQ